MDSELTSWTQRNEFLFKTGLRADCYFLVGVVADNQRLFQAHKFILSNASPVFERMFYGSLPEKENQPIEIFDIEADDFYDMLHFIYTEDISIASVDKAQQLYYAANKYMLKQLMQECIDYLKKNKTKDNVCGIFEFAKQFDERSLEEDCMNFIKTNTSTVLKSSSLLLADISTLDAILSQDRLNISKELELFNALERYADFRFLINKRREPGTYGSENLISISEGTTNKRKSDAEVTENVDDEINPNTAPENGESWVRQVNKKTPVPSRQQTEDIVNFLSLLKKIRFLTFTNEDFTSGPALSKLLSKSDALDLLLCLLPTQNTEIQLPNGFSESRTRRVP